MKAVLLSIRPNWCKLIWSGMKTVEVRKTRPKLETPFKCYVYCTRDKHLAFMQNASGTNLIACMDVDAAIPVGGAIGNGKVIGEFTCDDIYEIDSTKKIGAGFAEDSCVSSRNIHEYLGGQTGYGWHISNLKIYDPLKDLGDFTGLRETKFGSEPVTIKRPPQSWRYVEEQK